MPRRMTRSEENQVGPDKLVNRRHSMPYSIDEPVASASRTWPLLPSGGSPGVFEVTGLDLEGVESGHDLPLLVYGGHQVHTQRSSGKTVVNSATALFSINSKMHALSFGLPAGPLSEGGSCIAANPASTWRRAAAGALPYICDICYSLEGRYPMVEVATAQGARLTWVLGQLQDDPSGTRLAAAIVKGIVDFARHTRLVGVRGGEISRNEIELGVWRDGRLEARSRDRSWRPVQPTWLPRVTGFRNSWELLEQTNPTDGDVCGFFRIHESGDLNVGPGVSTWKGYLSAWTAIAHALPHVLFWLPTRSWVVPDMLEQLQRASLAAPNLIVRCSALRVGEPAPVLAGLPHGSSVALRGKTPRDWTPTMDTEGEREWVCPVKGRWEWDPDMVPVHAGRRKAGQMGDWVTPKSCQDAKCRACWVMRGKAVSYVEKV